MFQHILIRTDGSQLSRKAIEHGIAIAKETRAKVTGITVSSVPISAHQVTRSVLKWLIVAGTIMGFSAYGIAQDIDFGKMDYESSCGSCHGKDGKGDGPLSEELRTYRSKPDCGDYQIFKKHTGEVESNQGEAEPRVPRRAG